MKTEAKPRLKGTSEAKRSNELIINGFVKVFNGDVAKRSQKKAIIHT